MVGSITGVNFCDAMMQAICQVDHERQLATVKTLCLIQTESYLDHCESDIISVLKIICRRTILRPTINLLIRPV